MLENISINRENYIFLLICGMAIFCSFSADATVIEFKDNGDVVRHEAHDYLSKVRYGVKPKIFPVSRYEDFIKSASDKYDVSENLIHAVIKAESNYNQDALSHKGAMGLMQLMPRTAKSLSINDAFNPEQNINGGTSVLARLLKKYDGDLPLSLAAYNAGEGAVKKYNGVPPFKETKEYIEKIHKHLSLVNLN